MTRGDLITAVLPGNYGKPRPCLVVQTDRLARLDSVVLCPLTSDLDTIGPARPLVPVTPENGLKVESLVMVDKVTAVSRSRCRERIGRIEGGLMETVSGLLFFVLGLGD